MFVCCGQSLWYACTEPNEYCNGRGNVQTLRAKTKQLIYWNPHPLLVSRGDAHAKLSRLCKTCTACSEHVDGKASSPCSQSCEHKQGFVQKQCANSDVMVLRSTTPSTPIERGTALTNSEALARTLQDSSEGCESHVPIRVTKAFASHISSPPLEIQS